MTARFYDGRAHWPKASREECLIGFGIPFIPDQTDQAIMFYD
jgi:hypothetical protein